MRESLLAVRRKVCRIWQKGGQMPDLKQNGESDFITERIKIKPVNKKKLIRRTIITVAMAVIFGLVACVTFLILEPVISNWLYPKEEQQPEIVKFPEDRDEMLPEDMLAENLPTESPKPTPEPTPEPEQEEVVLEEDQIQAILEGVTLDLQNYKELYSVMTQYVNELNKYMVTVTAVTSNVDWFNSVQESRNQCPGLIISDNGIELLILADYSPITSAERLLLTFHNGLVVEGQIKKQNRTTNLAVVSAALADLPEGMNEELPKAASAFGYSNALNLVGTPVVAVGSPMGSSNSVGYGMITSASTILSMTDRNYKLLQTDINGSQSASGVLFDLQGQVVGIITNGKTGSDMRNMITAYGITDLSRIVEKMSNASPMAYMGIRGVDVPREAHQELGVPYGAYVENIDMDSPAMRAGIQRGDIITLIDDTSVVNFNGYSNALMTMAPGQTVTVKVMRQAQEEYREMSFSIELGEVE